MALRVHLTGRCGALLYDAAMGVAEHLGLRRMRRALVSSIETPVLEIGSGTGRIFPFYGEDQVIVAIEPNLEMLARSRARQCTARAHIVLVAADAQALPFRPNCFQTVVVGLALCTIPDPSVALDEMRRVVRSSGQVRLLEHVRIDRPLIGRIQDLLTPLWCRIAGGCHLNRRTMAAVRHAGFEVSSVTRSLGGALLEITARQHRLVR